MYCRLTNEVPGKPGLFMGATGFELSAIAHWIAQTSSQPEDYWRLVVETVYNAYRDGFIEGRWGEWKSGDVESIRTTRAIADETLVPMKDVIRVMAEVRARVDMGDLAPEVILPGKTLWEKTKDVAAGVAPNFEKSVKIALAVGAVGLGLYIFTMIQLPKIKPVEVRT